MLAATFSTLTSWATLTSEKIRGQISVLTRRFQWMNSGQRELFGFDIGIRFTARNNKLSFQPNGEVLIIVKIKKHEYVKRTKPQS